jgi:hypothetical protein
MATKKIKNMSKRKTIDAADEETDRNDMVIETPTGTRMEVETPNLEVQRFVHNPHNYKKMMLIYQHAAPGTISNRVCHTKTGIEGDDVCLAREDSTPDNVICPDGYHPSAKWPFCCVKDGVDERVRDMMVNVTSKGMDESDTKRLRRVEFGILYRSLHPHASKEITDKKYKAYLKLFVMSHL